ncbi:MAG: Hsp20/alpha crystallin family protein [Candidatus Riflebacteria bacterium]|nr:Hsp20/alpha crystallin family protein [Candidatus Riflebacteria bacterium]
MKEKPEKEFVCETCGQISPKEGHLCKPLNLEEAYTCEFCGNVTSDPRHVCKPKMGKLEYVCGNCGRVSIDKEFLCNPRSLLWAPLVDFQETEENYIIEADLPGVLKEDLKLDLVSDTLEIKGIRKNREGEGTYHMTERMVGSFQRSLVLPDSIERDKINASFADGILRLTIPKSKEAIKKKVGIRIK